MTLTIELIEDLLHFGTRRRFAHREVQRAQVRIFRRARERLQNMGVPNDPGTIWSGSPPKRPLHRDFVLLREKILSWQKSPLLLKVRR